MYRANIVLICIDFMTAWIRWFRSNTSTQHVNWRNILTTWSVTEHIWTRIDIVDGRHVSHHFYSKQIVSFFWSFELFMLQHE